MPCFCGEFVTKLGGGNEPRVDVENLSLFPPITNNFRPEDLDNFFQHWKGILLFSVTITASEMAALIYALGPSPVTEAVFQGPFYQAIGFNVDETAYMGAVIFINNRLNWKLFLVLCFFGMLTFIGGVIMVTLAVKIGKTLKTNAGESATLAQHQKKIFTLLIFQVSQKV